MKLTNTIALCFASTMLWNCNDTTQPEKRVIDSKVPAIVNSVANYAAYSAGLKSIEVTAAEPLEGLEDENPFSAEGLVALEGIGLCQNFILIVQELVNSLQSLDPMNQQSFDPLAASPRLAEAFQCLGSKSQEFAAVAPTPEQAIGLIDQCLCAGSGTFLGNFLFATYNPPSVPGKSYSVPGVPGKAYAAPSIPGYSAPVVPGNGYAPPSL